MGKEKKEKKKRIERDFHLVAAQRNATQRRWHQNHFGNWIRLTRARASIRNLPHQASATSTLACPRGTTWVILSCCLSLLLSHPPHAPLFPLLPSLKRYHHDLPVLKRWMMPVHSSKPASVAWGKALETRQGSRTGGARSPHPRGQSCQACQGGACRCCMSPPARGGRGPIAHSITGS